MAALPEPRRPSEASPKDSVLRTDLARRRGPRHPWLDQPPAVVVVEPVGTDWRTWWVESGQTAYATLARLRIRRLAHEAHDAQAGGEAEAQDVAMS